MVTKLPKHIITSLKKNKTSLGEHPSLPPDEEDTFLISLLSKYYTQIDEITEQNDVNTIQEELQKLLTQCKKIENTSIDALEELCQKVVTNLFQVPEDTIVIECKIVNDVNVSQQRFLPDSSVEYTFDDISDMSRLTDEVYKRRMLNALVVGAAMFYSNNIDFYVQDLFKINPELPSLHKKILDLNTKLLYLQKDSLTTSSSVNGGKVDVLITSQNKQVKICAEGIIFPILLEEVIKGILEVAISHGLPLDREKAEYVTRKADFRLAETWDMRLGVPLWLQILSLCEELNLDIMGDSMINFFLYEVALLDVKSFNHFLQNVFKKTKEGKRLITDMVNNIKMLKGRDEFNDFIQTQRNKHYIINDDVEYFSVDELLSDEF